MLRRAWRQRPDDFWVNYELGSILWNGTGFDRPAEAVQFFSIAVAIRPRSSVARTGLGSALYDQGELDEAIVAFRQSIGLKPEFALAHINLGSVLKRQGKLDDAIAAYRAAIRLRPDDADAHDSLGRALHEKGSLDEAITEFRNAIHLKPDYALGHTDLGTALRSRGDFATASAEFRKALELAKGNLGLSFRNRGELMQTDHEADLAARLLAVIRGDAKPKGGAESLELAYYAPPDQAICGCRTALCRGASEPSLVDRRPEARHPLPRRVLCSTGKRRQGQRRKTARRKD